jgi:hypothetical protein
VEKRPVRVHTTHGRLGVPVSHKTFRGNYSLQDPVRCPGTVTADAKDALATVGIGDSQNRVAVSPGAAADLVNDTPWCCKIGELPTDLFPYLVGAASGRGVTAKRLPGPATGDTARRPPTCGPDEGPRTRASCRQVNASG